MPRTIDFFLITALTLSMCSIGPAENGELGAKRSHCTKEDHRYAQQMGHGPAEEANAFAQSIKTLLRQKDHSSFWEKVIGELDWGPRKSFALSSPFD